jgi:membrane-associated phospholipid phosphatase
MRPSPGSFAAVLAVCAAVGHLGGCLRPGPTVGPSPDPVRRVTHGTAFLPGRVARDPVWLAGDASHPSPASPAERAEARVGWFDWPTVSFSQDAPAASLPPAGESAAPPAGLGEIVKGDLAAWPRELWTDLKLSYTPRNALILAAGGAAAIGLRKWVDDDAADHWRRNGDSQGVAGNIADIVGHPGAHFAAAATCYLLGAGRQDAGLLRFGRRAINTLLITDVSVLVAKGLANSSRPNGDRWGFPSGHAASSFAMATLIDDEFGHGWGAAAFALAGYITYARVDGGKHDVSDAFFGALLGVVIAHGICEGREPKVAGWSLLPYAEPGGGGIALVREF